MKETTIKGTFGTVVPIFLAITATQVEQWLRIASFAVGVLVGLVTLAGLIKRWNKP